MRKVRALYLMKSRRYLTNIPRMLEHVWRHLTRPVFRCVTWLTTESPCRICPACGAPWRPEKDERGFQQGPCGTVREKTP